MVVLNRIYTKTGDAGQPHSAPASGGARTTCASRPMARSTRPIRRSAWRGWQRRPPRSWPGSTSCWRASRTTSSISAPTCARRIPASRCPTSRSASVEPQVERLESDIDQLNAELAPLRSFVLPGGSPAAAHLHLARTIVRRAERLIVHLDATANEPVGAAAMKYLNRLSDFLFVAARHANDCGPGDVLWVPGKFR